MHKTIPGFEQTIIGRLRYPQYDDCESLSKWEQFLIVDGAKTQPYGFGVLPASCFNEDLTFLNITTPISTTD